MQAVESKEDKEGKIEITPQMIEAGVWAANLHWPENDGYTHLVQNVYEEMEKVRLNTADKNH